MKRTAVFQKPSTRYPSIHLNQRIRGLSKKIIVALAIRMIIILYAVLRFVLHNNNSE